MLHSSVEDTTLIHKLWGVEETLTCLIFKHLRTQTSLPDHIRHRSIPDHLRLLMHTLNASLVIEDNKWWVLLCYCSRVKPLFISISHCLHMDQCNLPTRIRDLPSHLWVSVLIRPVEKTSVIMCQSSDIVGFLPLPPDVCAYAISITLLVLCMLMKPYRRII